MPGVAAGFGALPDDPTVASLEQKLLIESQYSVSLRDTPPEVLRFLVDRSRQAGNDAFKRKDYKGAGPGRRPVRGSRCLVQLRSDAPPSQRPRAEATKMYSQAIAGDEGDAALYSNRSAAYLAQGLLEQAVWDAKKAVALRPEWGKGHYRLGAALSALNLWPEAAAALAAGAAADPENGDMVRGWLAGWAAGCAPSPPILHP